MATSWPFQDLNRRDVITDDGNDPDTSWQAHLNRTGRGGVDHICPAGSPVYANAAGTVRKTYLSDGGSGGRMVKVTAGNGWQDWYVHLSAFAAGAGDGQTVTQGQLIGYSGGSGYGTDDHYIPHLHLHRVDPSGVRQNPHHYWAGDGATDTRTVKPGKIEATLDTGIPNVTYWRRATWFAQLTGGYLYPCAGVFQSIPLIAAWQTALRPYGYTGTVDGRDSAELRKAWQRLARQGGYTGPIDGDLGTYSYKALSAVLNTF